MDTSALRPAYETAGPFATALIDVSQDSENSAREHDLHVREACDRLSEQGATDKLVERVRERLAEPPGAGAPVARLVVATEDDVSVAGSAALGGEPTAALLRWEERPDNQAPDEEV